MPVRRDGGVIKAIHLIDSEEDKQNSNYAKIAGFIGAEIGQFLLATVKNKVMIAQEVGENCTW